MNKTPPTLYLAGPAPATTSLARRFWLSNRHFGGTPTFISAAAAETLGVMEVEAMWREWEKVDMSTKKVGIVEGFGDPGGFERVGWSVVFDSEIFECMW